MLYRVMWAIDIDADTAMDAAVAVRWIQLDPTSTATFFEVLPVELADDTVKGELVDVGEHPDFVRTDDDPGVDLDEEDPYRLSRLAMRGEV